MALVSSCAVSPPPTLDGVSPALLCDESGPQTITITGSALRATVIGALTDEPELRLPTLRFEPQAGLAVDEPAATDRAVEVLPGSNRVQWVDDQTLEVDIDGALGLSEGSWDLVVTAVDGQVTRLSPALSVAGPPTVSDIAPMSVCHEAEQADLTITGEAFLVLDDGGLPSVTIDGQPVEVLDADGCTELRGPAAGQRCTELSVRVDPTLLALGDVAVTVQNPTPADCVSTEPATIEIAPPPTISAVSPDTVCATSGALVIEGEGFLDGMTVEVEGATVDSVTVIDSTTLEVQISGGDAGIADVTVIDPSGCSDTLGDALTLADEPIIFYVDPPAIYSGTDTQLAAFAAGVFGEVTDAWIEHVETAETQAVEWSWSAEEPGTVTLVAPAGLLSGEWRVVVVEDEVCDSRADVGFEVVTDLTVAVDSVDPEHTWTWNETAIEVYATDPLPSGTVGFTQTPRVYLIGPDGASTSTRLPAVVWRSTDRLTAVVPDSLPTGSYDVLVVNPEGELGLEMNGLTITEDAPPTISAVTPTSISKSSDQELTIRGRDFRSPVVSLDCRESGSTSTAELTVESSTSTEVVATLAGGTFGDAVCVVRLTNSDSTTVRWSAISVTNPAQNLFPWSAGPELNVARRAPSAAASRTSSVSRYVYAVGGDDGETSSALDSVEFASVGVYGTVGEWTLLADPLPEPRTLAAAAAIGRFVYLVGGSDGASPVDTTLRAMTLDPLDTPWFDRLSLERDAEAGLGPGTWSYQVSALYEATHTSNPGGEGLPGELVTMELPAVDGLLVPTLTWTAVDGAAGYRVYRSPEADASTDELAWVGDVAGDTLSFKDLGDAADAGLAPLPDGALGKWAELPSMSTAREAPCIAIAPDVEIDPERYWLFAAGGLDAEGELLDSIEVLEILVESDQVQTATEWTVSSQVLSEARQRCGGLTVDSSHHTVVEEGEAWVYFIGGEAESKTSAAVDAGRVVEEGALEDWQAIKDISPARAGFGYASGSDFLYLLGGRQSGPHAGGVSGMLSDGALPEVDSWNSLGTSMTDARALPGSAQESAVIIIVGGQTDSEDATTSTDVTNY